MDWVWLFQLLWCPIRAARTRRPKSKRIVTQTSKTQPLWSWETTCWPSTRSSSVRWTRKRAGNQSKLKETRKSQSHLWRKRRRWISPPSPPKHQNPRNCSYRLGPSFVGGVQVEASQHLSQVSEITIIIIIRHFLNMFYLLSFFEVGYWELHEEWLKCAPLRIRRIDVGCIIVQIVAPFMAPDERS